jgi:hypothetical protein
MPAGLPAGLAGLIALAIGLVIVWVVVSIPAYVAGKIVTSGRATIGQAMAATLGGYIVYFVVLVVTSIFLGALIGASAGLWALLLAFIAWLAVYRSSFDTTWIGALAISILSFAVTVVIGLILASLFNISFFSPSMNGVSL